LNWPGTGLDSAPIVRGRARRTVARMFGIGRVISY
jgi:hypothetical protein